MITIPVYDLLVLPGVSFYFKKDMFPVRKITSEDIGENVLFLVLKEEKDRKDLVPEDFYPIGVSAKIESIDEEGTVRPAFCRMSMIWMKRKKRNTLRGSGKNCSISPKILTGVCGRAQ